MRPERHWYLTGVLMALLCLEGCGWSQKAPGWNDIQVDTNRKGAVQVDAELRGQYLLLENLIDQGVFDDDPAPARKAKNLLDRARGYHRGAWAAIKTQEPNTAMGEDLMSSTAQILSVVTAILGDAAHSADVPLPE